MANIFVHIWLGCLKLIFTFLHLVYSGFQYFDLIWTLFKRKIDFFIGAHQSTDEFYISNFLAGLEKRPRHLAVILGNEAVLYEDFTNLVIWCLAAGISFLTVYDHSGLTGDHESKLYEYVLRRFKTSHSQIKFRNIPAKNGTNNGYRNKIVVNILTQADGKVGFTTLVRQFCRQIDSSKISIETLSKEIKSASQFPDPELALIVGAVMCTYGFPPWQIPVTEFLRIPSLRNLSAPEFCNILSTYSNCQQRFGT